MQDIISVTVVPLKILTNYNFLFIIQQLGLILDIRTPPITTPMHRDSRASIYIKLSQHIFINFFRRPSQFRELSVDPQVRTSDGRTSDVLFVGTTEGRILKIVNTADPTNYRASRYIIKKKGLEISFKITLRYIWLWLMIGIIMILYGPRKNHSVRPQANSRYIFFHLCYSISIEPTRLIKGITVQHLFARKVNEQSCICIFHTRCSLQSQSCFLSVRSMMPFNSQLNIHLVIVQDW